MKNIILGSVLLLSIATMSVSAFAGINYERDEVIGVRTEGSQHFVRVIGYAPYIYSRGTAGWEESYEIAKARAVIGAHKFCQGLVTQVSPFLFNNGDGTQDSYIVFNTASAEFKCLK